MSNKRAVVNSRSIWARKTPIQSLIPHKDHVLELAGERLASMALLCLQSFEADCEPIKIQVLRSGLMTEEIDVEKSYSNKEVVAKLRRLADALESGKSFDIQIGGQRIAIPPDASVEFEYQREGKEEEVEIELRWKRR